MKRKAYPVVPQMMRVGMFVMVSEWLDAETPSVVYGTRPRPIGLPLRVLSLALPHMVVEYCAIKDLRGIMDTRQASFMRIPRSYVTALIPQYGKKKPKAADVIDNTDAFIGYEAAREI